MIFSHHSKTMSLKYLTKYKYIHKIIYIFKNYSNSTIQNILHIMFVVDIIFDNIDINNIIYNSKILQKFAYL